MALARCILGKFLGVGYHFFPPPLAVPTFSARCLNVQRRERPLVAKGGTLRGREMFRQIWPRMRLPRNSRDLLHAANLRHETDGFTSPPKEGVLKILSPLKIWRLRPGLNPRTWVPKASTLPLDHRSEIAYDAKFLQAVHYFHSNRQIKIQLFWKSLPMFRRRILPPSSISSGPRILYFDSYNLNIQAAPSFDTHDTSK